METAIALSIDFNQIRENGDSHKERMETAIALSIRREWRQPSLFQANLTKLVRECYAIQVISS